MSEIDWTQIYKDYAGQWIALKDDEKTVISSAKSAKDAFDTAVNSGFSSPIMMKIPAELTTYIG